VEYEGLIEVASWKGGTISLVIWAEEDEYPETKHFIYPQAEEGIYMALGGKKFYSIPVRKNDQETLRYLKVAISDTVVEMEKAARDRKRLSIGVRGWDCMNEAVEFVRCLLKILTGNTWEELQKEFLNYPKWSILPRQGDSIT
jgi:hypothetical protein